MSDMRKNSILSPREKSFLEMSHHDRKMGFAKNRLTSLGYCNNLENSYGFEGFIVDFFLQTSLILAAENKLKSALEDIAKLKESIKLPEQPKKLEVDLDDIDRDPTTEELRLWKKRGGRLSPAGEAFLYACDDANKTPEQIARRMGIHVNSVSRVKRRRPLNS